ncbi:MAG: prepilin-type N-terminal cleavage/methylation domain-containing protein [Deltaproteobacteria bacterium]|nr:prepilin-type N-terminal cleavage/methylation domain-containing protein [Deltaproteobacteria bacterium]
MKKVRSRKDAAADSPLSAFTLLEVMVAVGILGVALTAIFSSEAGAIKMAHSSRKMGLAVELARCKMAEIEEKIAKEGLPAVFASDSDKCCEETEIEGFSCDWDIDRIVLPDTMFEGQEGEESTSRQEQPNLLETATSDPLALLSGGGEFMGDIASTAMLLVYPILKPSVEEQIRSVTVTVKWREGSRERSFDVSQYLVAEQPPPDDEQAQPEGNLQ